MKIEELIIATKNLQEQLQFYAETLGLPLVSSNEDSFSVQIGSSVLTFRKREDQTPYHFAFNISSNKEEEALIWLKERVAILPLGKKEIADFVSWNAKSIYFYDKDKNIAEFIARKNLNILSSDPFNESHILNISEIGIPVSDIEKTYKTLNSLQTIEVYDGSFDRFCALGNEDGLFIVINKDEKDWYPTGDKAFASEFEIMGDFNFKFKNGEILPLL